MYCNTPEIVCHPERPEKIEDFRRESKDLRTNLTVKVTLVRRSFDSLSLAQDDKLGLLQINVLAAVPSLPYSS